MTETNVEIKTPDGTCDAAFIHPATGAHPAVIIWPDAFGLRPSMRDMAKRLAARRLLGARAEPVLPRREVADLGGRVEGQLPDRARRSSTPLMGSIQADGAVEKDAPALIAWLDMQKQVDRNKKIGTQGYCMGGGLVVQDGGGGARSRRRRRLVPRRRSRHRRIPNSPHLLAPKIKARMYFGIATNDDMQQPDAKTKLKEAFDAAKVPVEVEVYSMAQHGWCVPDMPAQANGQPIYKKDDAERAWGKLIALYKAGLV